MTDDVWGRQRPHGGHHEHTGTATDDLPGDRDREGAGEGDRDRDREGVGVGVGDGEGEGEGEGVGVGDGEGEGEGEGEVDRVGDGEGEGEDTMITEDDYEPEPGADEDPQGDDYAAWLAERDRDEPDTCQDCAGSGEGHTDESDCLTCGGSGVERDRDEDERREAALEDMADARRDDRMTGVYDDD